MAKNTSADLLDRGARILFDRLGARDAVAFLAAVRARRGTFATLRRKWATASFDEIAVRVREARRAPPRGATVLRP
jgi:hypothetical protein